MAVSASHRTLDVHGVADLQATLTSKRPNDATIRSYHSRGLMPPQIEPGRWAEEDIRQWLHRRRVRPSPEATRALCDKLARAARRTANPDDHHTIEALVNQARGINIGWTTIRRALEISGQAAWARYHRRSSTTKDAT